MIQGKPKTYEELRQDMYERIVDEAVYIARASEGSMSVEWVMSQPIFVRKKYFKQMQKEIEARDEKMKKNKRRAGKNGPSYAKNTRTVGIDEIISSSTST